MPPQYPYVTLKFNCNKNRWDFRVMLAPGSLSVGSGKTLAEARKLIDTIINYSSKKV